MNGKKTTDLEEIGLLRDGGLQQEEQSQTSSENSEEQSSDSKILWQTPKNIKEFATQANLICTLVLNGEIDMEKAKLYSSLARVVAQAMTTELSKARIAKTMPDLEFDEDYGKED